MRLQDQQTLGCTSSAQLHTTIQSALSGQLYPAAPHPVFGCCDCTAFEALWARPLTVRRGSGHTALPAPPVASLPPPRKQCVSLTSPMGGGAPPYTAPHPHNPQVVLLALECISIACHHLNSAHSPAQQLTATRQQTAQYTASVSVSADAALDQHSTA
jgi:hypothetical protein